MVAAGELALSIRITTVVVPVALYFLILGLLNSRPRPQLLRARRDFLLLLCALGPVFALPAMEWTDGSPALLAVGGIGAAAALVLLAPPRACWVIYNIGPRQAAEAVGQTLRAAGIDAEPAPGGFRLADGGCVRLGAFALLHNVSIRLTGAPRETADAFEAALSRRIEAVPAETTPLAMALVLVATAMLVAPFAFVAPRAGEIVRILTGMLY